MYNFYFMSWDGRSTNWLWFSFISCSQCGHAATTQRAGESSILNIYIFFNTVLLLIPTKCPFFIKTYLTKSIHSKNCKDGPFAQLAVNWWDHFCNSLDELILLCIFIKKRTLKGRIISATYNLFSKYSTVKILKLEYIYILC